MKRRAILLPRAIDDKAEIYAYLAQHSADAAHRFLDRLEETLERISSLKSPGIAWDSLNQSLTGLRWIKVAGFPNHLIFIRISGETLEVVRILHGARDIQAILGE